MFSIDAANPNYRALIKYVCVRDLDLLIAVFNTKISSYFAGVSNDANGQELGEKMTTNFTVKTILSLKIPKHEIS